MTKISSKSIVAASANQKIPVSPDNAISPNTIKIYADAAVDLTTVQAVALGASADDGTLYRITGTGGSPLPTGIDNILIWGASSMAGGFDYGNARASVTALGVYVPCTYDVGTNKISCKYIAWAGTISQSGGSDATINETMINLIGETPVFDASSTGILDIQTTTWNWPQHKTILFSPHYFDGSNLWSPSLQWGSATSLTLYMVKGDGSLVDDMYVNQYIELSVIISNL